MPLGSIGLGLDGSDSGALGSGIAGERAIPPTLATLDELVKRNGVAAWVSNVELIEPDANIEVSAVPLLEQIEGVQQAVGAASHVHAEPVRPLVELVGEVDEFPSVDRSPAEALNDREQSVERNAFDRRFGVVP